jgi:hypothetical protein
MEWSGSLGVGAGCDVGGVAGGEADDALCDGVGNIWLSIKQRKGRRRLVYAATTKSPEHYSRSSKKLMKAKTNDFYCCYR